MLRQPLEITDLIGMWLKVKGKLPSQLAGALDVVTPFGRPPIRRDNSISKSKALQTSHYLTLIMGVSGIFGALRHGECVLRQNRRVPSLLRGGCPHFAGLIMTLSAPFYRALVVSASKSTRKQEPTTSSNQPTSPKASRFQTEFIEPLQLALLSTEWKRKYPQRKSW